MALATGLVRDREAVHELDDVARWLSDRDGLARAQVEMWMIRRESLSTDVLAQLWADRSWSEALSGVLLETIDGQDAPAGSEQELVRGFLMGVSAGRGVAVLGIDGTTRWLARRRWTVVHPVLLAQAQAWSDAAREFGIRQAVSQLGRAWTVRDAAIHRDTDTAAVVHGVALTAAPVQEQLPLWESGAWLTAELRIEAGTAVLSFLDADGRPLRLAGVGPIAWSEAVRAARLFQRVRSAGPRS